MLRKLLGVLVAVGLPSLLAAQTPVSPHAAKPVPVVAPSATQVQGDVVTAEAPDEANDQDGVEKADGQHNDNDVESNETDEPNDVDSGSDSGHEVEHAGQTGDEDAPAAPTTGSAQATRIGRHKP